jgi:hypothetical protein
MGEVLVYAGVDANHDHTEVRSIRFAKIGDAASHAELCQEAWGATSPTEILFTVPLGDPKELAKFLHPAWRFCARGRAVAMEQDQ